MSGIEFEGRTYTFRNGETVLEALVRGGASVNYSCRRGTCQACILQVDGDATHVALKQVVLPRARLDSGTFLACQTKAASMSVKRLEKSALFVPARLIDRKPLGRDILRVRLEPPGSFMWHPGQYVNIRHPSGALRSYAVTSLVFTDYWLELHVRCFPTALVSSWLRDELRIGDFIELQGPFGDCHFRSSMINRPLILVATDVGVGTLLGVAREAELRGHTREIALYHETSEPGYAATLTPELHSQHPKLTLTECSAEIGLTSHRQTPESATNSTFNGSTALANTIIFLCGDSEMVQRAQTVACSLGANPDQVLTIAFDPAA